MNVFIMGGKYTEDLAEAFESTSGGTVNVRYKVESISESFLELKTQRISVDKLVIYMDSSMNIVREFSALSELMCKKEGNELIKNKYCDIKEIFLFVKQDEDKTIDNSKKIQSSFISYMKSMSYKSFFIYPALYMTYEDIYNRTTGLKSGSTAKNTRRTVMVVDRNNRALNSYDQEFFDKVIEPFSYERIEAYERIKDLSKRVDTGNPIIDNEYNSDNLVDNLQLTRLSSIDAESVNKSIDIISGIAKTGTSTLCTTLAISYLDTNKKLILFDFSNSQGTSIHLKYNPIVGKKVLVTDIKELLFYNPATLNDFDLIVIQKMELGFGNRDVTTSLLFLLKTFLDIDFRRVMIDCELSDLFNITDVLNSRVRKSVITTSRFTGDVERVSKEIQNIVNGELSVIPMDSLFAMKPRNDLGIFQIDSILNGRNVIHGFKYNPYISNYNLLKSLLG